MPTSTLGSSSNANESDSIIIVISRNLLYIIVGSMAVFCLICIILLLYLRNQSFTNMQDQREIVYVQNSSSIDNIQKPEISLDSNINNNEIELTQINKNNDNINNSLIETQKTKETELQPLNQKQKRESRIQTIEKKLVTKTRSAVNQNFQINVIKAYSPKKKSKKTENGIEINENQSPSSISSI